MVFIKAFFMNFAIFLLDIGNNLRQRIPNFRKNWHTWQQRRAQRAAERQERWMNQARRQWEHFYREVFGIEVDLSAVAIPAFRKGFKRIVIVIPGLSIGLVYMAMKRYFRWYWLKEPSFIVDTTNCCNDREADWGAYAILVRDTPDIRRNRQLSAAEAEYLGIQGETLLEHLLHSMMYMYETGNPLDGEDNCTVCVGTKVYWTSIAPAAPYVHASNRQRGYEISVGITSDVPNLFLRKGVREVIV